MGAKCSSIEDGGANAKEGKYEIPGLSDAAEQEYQFSKEKSMGSYALSDVKHRVTGVIYQCSIYTKKNTPCQDGQKIADVITNMKACDHPNMKRLCSAFANTKNVYLIYEKTAGLTIDEYIQRRPDDISEQLISLVGKQIVRAIAACDQMGIVHGRIVPRNVIYSVDCRQVVLCDYAIVNVLTTDPTDEAIIEELAYLAPELCSDWCEAIERVAPEEACKKKLHMGRGDNIAPTAKADLWAAGVLLYQLMCRQKLFHYPDNVGKRNEPAYFSHCITVLQLIVAPTPVQLRLPKSMNSNAKDIVEKMLVKDPVNRLGCDGFLKHPFCRDGARLSQMAVARDVAKNIANAKHQTEFRKFVVHFVSRRNTQQDQTAKLIEVFDSMDDDGSGCLETKEIATLLSKFPDDTGGASLEDIMKSLDDDGNGFITLREFLASAVDTDAVLGSCDLFEVFNSLGAKKRRGVELPWEALEIAIRDLEGRLPAEKLEDLVSHIQAEMSLNVITYEHFLSILDIKAAMDSVTLQCGRIKSCCCPREVIGATNTGTTSPNARSPKTSKERCFPRQGSKEPRQGSKEAALRGIFSLK